MRVYIVLEAFAKSKEAMGILYDNFNEVVIRKGGTRPNEDEMIGIVQEYDVVIGGVKEKLTSNIYNLSNIKMKCFCSYSIGLDHISKEFLTDKNYKIINLTTSNVITVAEFIITYLLNNLKNLEDADKCFRDGSGRSGLKKIPTELSSYKIGVIGAGNIPQKFFEITSWTESEKLCWTFNPEKHKNLEELGVKFVDLDDLARISDYIVVAIPFSEKTKHIINSKFMKQMKPTAKLINISRLETIEIDEYIANTMHGKLVGSLIDCFPHEIRHDIADLDNNLFTPHIAGINVESRKRMAVELAVGLEKWIKCMTQ